MKRPAPRSWRGAPLQAKRSFAWQAPCGRVARRVFCAVRPDESGLQRRRRDAVATLGNAPEGRY